MSDDITDDTQPAPAKPMLWVPALSIAIIILAAAPCLLVVYAMLTNNVGNANVEAIGLGLLFLIVAMMLAAYVLRRIVISRNPEARAKPWFRAAVYLALVLASIALLIGLMFIFLCA